MIFQDKEQIPFWSQTELFCFTARLVQFKIIAGFLCWFFQKNGLSTQCLQTEMKWKWLHILLTTSTFIQDNVKIHSITG